MKFKIKPLSLCLFLFLMLLTGCGTTAKSNSTSKTDASPETTTIPEAITVTSATTSETIQPEPLLVLPLTTNDSGKVMIQTVSKSTGYPFNSYIITSIGGETIVVDPTQMPSKDVIDLNPAAIISTHAHGDHVDIAFSDSYDCPKIMYTKEDITTRDFHIYTIWSQHNETPLAENSGNVIVVFEVDGLRIAHMGDIGQTEITEQQLEELGKIDIAFMQLENSFSNMNIINEKGFILLEQFNPTIVIPTHYTFKAFPKIEKRYGKTVTEFENVFAISKDELPDTPLNFYHITNTHKYN